MTDFTNWKILKSLINYIGDNEELQHQAEIAQSEYEEAANWCNVNQRYVINDDGLYYKTELKQEPSIEEKQHEVRSVRNIYLQEYDFTQLNDAPFTEQQKEIYAQYRQYLRDYTLEENWWEQNPLIYEEWITNNNN